MGKLVEEGEENAVGPAEADDVHGIAGSDLSFGRTSDGIVFFADCAIAAKIFGDGGEKFVGDAIGVCAETVAADALIGQQLSGRPRIWKIPLATGCVGAHDQPAWLLEEGEVFHDGASLLGRGEANPQGIEGGHVLVRRKRTLFEVIVEIQAAPGIPKIFLNVFLAPLGTIAPFFGIFFAPEQFAHLLHIFFGLIEQAVEANRSIVMSFCAVGSKSERYVVSGFAHGAITFVVVSAKSDGASPR